MMQKRMDGISLNTTDTDNVSRIQQFVLLDNPQFFYIEKSQYMKWIIIESFPELHSTNPQN